MAKLLYKISRFLIGALCIITSLSACSQQPKDNNMRWTAKYNFLDLYKVNVSEGAFNPGSAISLDKIVIPYENTIVMGAEKMVWKFNKEKKGGSIAVLFVSNDRGESYQEIKTGEKDLEYMESRGDYTLVKAYTMDSLAVKHYKILLLNNKTFELKKADEYAEPEDFSNYYYRDFDGKYIVLENFGKDIIVSLLNKNEYYSIPVDEIGKSYFHIGNGKIVYKKKQEIIEYDVKSKQSKILSVLKNKYEYFRYIDENLLLKKIELEDGDKYKYGIYDIYENKLYEETNENKSFYRYKNFVCDYRKLGVKPEIRYSYDYGKTWKSHHVQGFTILQSLAGFYKDQFLVTEGIFWHFDSPESGGRVMVGEFVK